MGTSTSSAGAGSNISFDPPWLDDFDSNIDTSYIDAPITPRPAPNSTTESVPNQPEQIDLLPPIPGITVAPHGRYLAARRSLTRFIQTGSQASLKKGMSSFIKKGLGGSSKAAHRMRSSTVAASALGGFLATAREGTERSINDWVASVKQRGLSAHDIALEVVKRLLPAGGSIDEESAKLAMSQAIIYLYEEYPDVDIFNLSDDQIADVMAYTLAFDVYNRAQLELGRCFEKLKYSATVIQDRLAQMNDYILEVIQQSMERVRGGSQAQSMREIATSTLQKALFVFEES